MSFCSVLSLCRGAGPGTHHTQETGPGPELHIKHTGNTHRKQSVNPSCRIHTLLHPALLSSRSQQTASCQAPAAHSADKLSSAVCTFSLFTSNPQTLHTLTYHESRRWICFSEGGEKFTLLLLNVMWLQTRRERPPQIHCLGVLNSGINLCESQDSFWLGFLKFWLRTLLTLLSKWILAWIQKSGTLFSCT